MALRRTEPEPGLPEWIMSYADMITILMAFFVVMYSMAGTKDEKKEAAVLQSLHERFGPMWPNLLTIGPAGFGRPDLRLPESSLVGSQPDARRAASTARDRTATGTQSRVATSVPGQQLALGGSLVFDGHDSEPTDEHRQALATVFGAVSGKPQRIEIRGHTSKGSLPSGLPYQDNWDLAYARCRNTMRQLVALGIDARRIRLGVAADNEPPAGGDAVSRTSAGRVDVFLLDEVVAPATTSEPNDGAEPVKAGEA